MYPQNTLTKDCISRVGVAVGVGDMEGAEDGGGAAGDDGAIISVVAVPSGDTDETSGGSRESAAAVEPLVTSWRTERPTVAPPELIRKDCVSCVISIEL